MALQRTHQIRPIVINGFRVSQVVIDPHYEEKHAESIDDARILMLVGKLDGRYELPEAVSNGYSYFSTLIELEGKQYRLIWLLEAGTIYVGIINAYRDDRRK